ncbi:MAG: DUF3604 domain-containing protein [Deltaproteobacteria bacterium]
MRKHLKIAVLVGVSVGVMVACKSSGTDKAESTTPVAAKAPTEAPAPAKSAAEARPKPNPLRNVYFGEQHMHSEMSPDAYAMGVRQTMDDAYLYGMGEEITLSTTGEKFKKATPYDFIALTDHAEYLGVFTELSDPKSPLHDNAISKLITSSDPADKNKAASMVIESITSSHPSGPFLDFVNPKILLSNWQRHVETANKYNDPGRFTTIIAFEWTSIPDHQNMHRNVFFRGDTGPEAPYSAFDSTNPEDLWTYMEIQREVGLDVLAIPHNGNVSNGLMYAPTTYPRGDAINARYAERRALNEPLTEMIQTKGASETHPSLSPNDEFADFEMFPNLIGSSRVSKVKHGYIRQALTAGLIHEEKLGTNPFKYGIVAGADVHSGYSGNEEFNWHGAHGVADDTPKARLDPKPNASGAPATTVGSAGATAVWAEENTRASIFDAMKRKETYGTSGPLIRLRFFGAWDYADDLTSDEEFVKKAYANGVPMGGDLAPQLEGAVGPTFAVQALKDPQSGNLDRVQIIKGWVERGKAKERIYNVALSDERTVGKKGKVAPVGNTVDVGKATYTNDIGDTQLSVVWTDPDFNPKQRAVYYVRVIEIPTPRWSTYDAAKLGVQPSKAVPATIQERAWSSPIWYTPPAKPTK